MPRVLSISSSRADIGILLPVWRALAHRGCDVHIFLTGMHAAAGAPDVGPLPGAARLHRGGANLSGTTPQQVAAAMASIASDTGGVLADIEPDVVLVVGDRLDMAPAALATVPFNVALAHLHGGEITEGALDDRLRHAMTKLAHLHCVSTEGARRRLLALGEEEWRIRVTGAPGLDTLLEAPEMDRAEFLSAVGFAADAAEFRLVTVHPETNSPDPEAPLRAVLGAIESRPAPTLFTAPNADPGGAKMRAVIETFVERFEWARFRASLGPVLYPNALRHARMMIGNSSSGVIEAGMFGLPVIDVGERQRGRDRDANVATVPNDVAAVGQAMDRISSDPVRHVGASLYGDGRSGPRIAAVLAELPERRRLLRKSHGPSVAAA